MKYTYNKLCVQTPKVINVDIDGSDFYLNFYGIVKRYCDTYGFGLGYLNYFRCVRKIYQEVYGMEYHMNKKGPRKFAQLAANSLYIHLRLSDERTDQRGHMIEEMSDADYSDIIRFVIANSNYKVIYASSRDSGRLARILSSACNNTMCFDVDKIANIADFDTQTEFFNALETKNITIIGSMSSNFETIMALHRHSPSCNFIELYKGFLWNLDHCRRNLYYYKYEHLIKSC